MSFKVISMFSGAGGLDMGFHNQGFKILWANDFAKDAMINGQIIIKMDQEKKKKSVRL